MEDSKNTKEDKKEKESPELKEELTEEELKGVDGGNAGTLTLGLGQAAGMLHADEPWLPKVIHLSP